MDAKNNPASIVERKLITTFLVASLVSLGWGALTVGSEGPYNMGNHLIGWVYVFFLYIGAIILIYGNAVSLWLEYAQKKWFKDNQWLYVFLHGIFGLANGLLFLNVGFAIAGMVVALLYGCVDRLLHYMALKQKKLYMLALIPIILCISAWGILEYVSPEKPPFTKDEAVKVAIADDGIVVGTFPGEIGTVKGTINGYDVTKKVSASEVEREKFLVVFTETWAKDGEAGSRSFSYLIGKDTFMSQGEKGEVPPYYFDSVREEEWPDEQ